MTSRTGARAVVAALPGFLLASLCACAPSQPSEAADLVLRGGKVVTVGDGLPEAEAIAVRGYQIVAVGSDEEIAAWVGRGTDVIELRGRLAIPGFIEGHGHYMSLGRAQTILDLSAAESWDEIVARVGESAREAEPGAWIFGRGWHQELWAVPPDPNVDGVPLHRRLSDASPDNPVSLDHASGHGSFVNAAAMRLAGIDGDTPDPPGGTIVKDAEGHPTGFLRETAVALVEAAIATWDAQRTEEERAAEARRMMELAGREALEHGVTSFQDAGASFDQIDRYMQWAREGALPVRLYVMVGLEESNESLAARLPDYLIVPEGNDFLAVRSIKRMIDGAIGSHGGWLLEPYADMPGSTGLILDEPASIEETCRLAVRHGFQVNTHAIGDRANREILDIYERVFHEHPEVAEARWRIEHAQHLHPDDVPRFAELGVIAAVQGIHCAVVGPWVASRLGEERAGEQTYLWRSLLDTGAMVINGSDAPIADIDPIAGFYASVTRRTTDGGYFRREQAMTRMEALRSYTIDGAYAAFEEHLKGSITPGKLADVVVLSRDILTILEEEIPAAEVDLTIVGGEIRFRRHPQAP